jgi:predicted permease
MKSEYGSKINSFLCAATTVSWRLIVVMALVLVAVAGFGATQTAFAVGPDPDGTNSASSSGAAGDIIFIPVAIANSSRGPLSYAEAPTIASSLLPAPVGTAS